MGLNAVRWWEPIKLVGIATDWKRSRKRILGASVTHLIPLLEKAVSSRP